MDQVVHLHPVPGTPGAAPAPRLSIEPVGVHYGPHLGSLAYMPVDPCMYSMAPGTFPEHGEHLVMPSVPSGYAETVLQGIPRQGTSPP